MCWTLSLPGGTGESTNSISLRRRWSTRQTGASTPDGGEGRPLSLAAVEEHEEQSSIPIQPKGEFIMFGLPDKAHTEEDKQLLDKIEQAIYGFNQIGRASCRERV